MLLVFTHNPIDKCSLHEGIVGGKTHDGPSLILLRSLIVAVQDVVFRSAEAGDRGFRCQRFDDIVLAAAAGGYHPAVDSGRRHHSFEQDLEEGTPQQRLENFPRKTRGPHAGLDDSDERPLHQRYCPASTLITCPVTWRAASLTRNTATLAISVGT